MRKNNIYILAALILLSISCSKTSNVDDLPTVIISSASVKETNGKTIASFKITLSKTSTEVVSFDFATVDGTAKSGLDYEARSGKFSIPASFTEAKIEVNILGDGVSETEEVFSIELANIKNGIALLSKANCIIEDDDAFVPPSDEGFNSPLEYAGYTLAWNDEFEGSKINTSNWTYDIGGNGWGNNELEYYTDSENNSFINNGKLIIEARKENGANTSFTSARIKSQGKKSFTYGRIDIRAKAPIAQGIWPALWMLGDNITTESWPACGEIDIMEIIGKEPSTLFGTLHWGNKGQTSSTNKGNNVKLVNETMGDKFRVYSFIWDENSITWLLDNKQFHSVKKSEVNANNYPFDKPFFFIMNVAVGGNWPGNPDGTTTFPQRMFVDYVRVFKKG